MPLTRVEPEHYDDLLRAKAIQLQEQFASLHAPPVEVHGSTPLGYRMRAEFRVWHQGDDLYYAMFHPQQPKPRYG